MNAIEPGVLSGSQNDYPSRCLVDPTPIRATPTRPVISRRDHSTGHLTTYLVSRSATHRTEPRPHAPNPSDKPVPAYSDLSASSRLFYPLLEPNTPTYRIGSVSSRAQPVSHRLHIPHQVPSTSQPVATPVKAYRHIGTCRYGSTTRIHTTRITPTSHTWLSTNRTTTTTPIGTGTSHLDSTKSADPEQARPAQESKTWIL